MAKNKVSVPAFEPIHFSLEQVQLMVRFAGILDPTLENALDPESSALPPQIGRRFHLKKDGDMFVWSPAV